MSRLPRMLAPALLLLLAGSALAGSVEDCPRFDLYHGPNVRVRVVLADGGAWGWDPASGAVVDRIGSAQALRGFYGEDMGVEDKPYWMLGFASCSTDSWPLRLEVYGTPEGGDYALDAEREGVATKRRDTIQPGGTHRYRLELLSPPLDAVRFVREDPVLPRFASPLADADPRVFPLGSVIPVALAVEGPLAEGTEGGATLRLLDRRWVRPDPEPGGRYGRGNRLEYDGATRAYRYDLDTQGVGCGSWLLEVTLGGEGPYTVSVELGAP